MQTPRIYRSKIDTWLILLFAIVFIPIGIAAVWDGKWVVLLILLPVIAFIAHLLANTYYTIGGSTLSVKSGFLVNISIDISAIKSIKETNSIISSPAASLDRLEISYNRFDSVIISPKDKAAFIADILTINGNIIVEYKP